MLELIARLSGVMEERGGPSVRVADFPAGWASGATRAWLPLAVASPAGAWHSRFHIFFRGGELGSLWRRRARAGSPRMTRFSRRSSCFLPSKLSFALSKCRERLKSMAFNYCIKLGVVNSRSCGSMQVFGRLSLFLGWKVPHLLRPAARNDAPSGRFGGFRAQCLGARGLHLPGHEVRPHGSLRAPG